MPRVKGKFVSDEPGPGRLTPRPMPGPLNSCWTLIVQLITASPGLWSVCVGTLCKHFLFGRAGNEGMRRSSDFTRLLLPCPSSQAPTRACWRPFPTLLHRVRGMARQFCGAPSPPVPGPGRPGVEPCSECSWESCSTSLSFHFLICQVLPHPVTSIEWHDVGNVFGRP